MTAETQVTPTEELIMEVLVARHRLGESLWTFDSKSDRAIKSLETKGLVRRMNGITDHSVRASLTAQGKKEYLHDGYVAPILQKYKLKKRYRRED